MLHLRTMLAVAPIALATLTASASAGVEGAADAVPPRTSALELAVSWDVVTLDDLAASKAGDRATVRLPLDQGPVELDLELHSVRSLDFMVFVQDEMGIRPAPLPPVTTYRGSVTGHPDSLAFGSIIDGRFTGQFRLDPGASWMIVEPLDEHDPTAGRFEHVVVDGRDILPHGHECGVTEAFLAKQAQGLDLIAADGDAVAQPALAGDGATRHVHGPDCNHGPASAGDAGAPSKSGAGTGLAASASGDGFVGMSEGGLLEVTDVLIDADFQFFLQNGGSVNNTISDIEGVMNGVSLVYERDTDLTWEITGVLVRTTSSGNPYTSSNAETLLCQMLTEWNQGGLSTIRRDTTHLFTGRELIGGTIGIAFNGVICNLSATSPCGGGAQNLAYGLSQSRFSSFFDARVSLTAHELGHNYNASHCSGGNCHIMCATINGCGGTFGLDLKFGPTSQNSIESFASTRQCLSVQPPARQIPFEDDFPTSTIDGSKWSWFVETVTSSSPPFTPPSAPRVAEFRSFSDIPFRQGDLRSVEIDLAGQSGIEVAFSAARVGLEAGEGLTVEYFASNGRWNDLFELLSDGTDQDFVSVSLPLPPFAYHDRFRVRFRLIGDDFGDRIFLDDVFVGVPQEEPCVGDTDGNGVVEFDDLLSVLAAFGPCPAPCAPDLDGNGVVEFDDLLGVLAAFGPCP